MKKCYSLLRWPCLLQDVCSTDVYCSKQTGSSSTKVKPSPIIFRFWNWADKKTVDAAKICGGAEMLLKQKPSKTFVNGLLGFITLGIYTPLVKRVCIAHNNCMSCPIDVGNSIWHAH